MNDPQIVDYLRSRGRAEPPPDFVQSVMVAIGVAPPARSGFTAHLPAFVALGAAAAMAAIALMLGPGRDVGPAPTWPAGPSAPASESTVDELRAALTAAVSVLRSTEGVEGITTARVFDEVGTASWFSWRPNGDQVVVQRSDVDVTETGWWRDPAGEPPGRGTNVSTTIQVLVGAGYYFTRGEVDGDDRWIAGLREGSPSVLGIPFPAALDGDVDPWQGEFVLTLEGEASMRRLGDGSQRWTLTRPVREGSLIQVFSIGQDGALRSVSHELVGVEPALDERPITSALVELTVLEDPEPIRSPDTDAAPDPGLFGMPELPLSPSAP